ncbi:VOC family protein [Marinactinospora thermotolerans]|uniref:Glyoxalase-like domain-containing protein n=1 Tax=Marinactinospora thermotolerans DSM 45154 TaxID=1122192 RepID=A0A1T4PT16_9ACTN|nr:VOC family protein [Marinactinospora thermotolerans]SJZ94426.1 Glyoxalase-like domain-containing protein [Marinactinospora thermotolerans DSM 45154]
MHSTAAPVLDHLVYATPDLPATVAQFTRATGVVPAEGGAHPGWGTRNHLVALDDGAYLEIVGPDPRQPDPEHARPFRVDRLTAPAVVTWAVRTTDIDAAVRRAEEHGYAPGPVLPMSRTTPDGRLLEWRLTSPEAAHPSGLVPFLIDWGTTPHPVTLGLPRVGLAGVELRAPDPAEVAPLLAALDLAVRPVVGETGISVTLDTLNGPVVLS